MARWFGFVYNHFLLTVVGLLALSLLVVVVARCGH